MEKPLDDDSLRMHFHGRFYNERVEVDDLHWEDVEPNIKKKYLRFTQKKKIVQWMSLAASILLVGLMLSYYFTNLWNEKLEPIQPALTENNQPSVKQKEPEPVSPLLTEKEEEDEQESTSREQLQEESVSKKSTQEGINGIENVAEVPLGWVPEEPIEWQLLGDDFSNEVYLPDSVILAFNDTGIDEIGSLQEGSFDLNNTASGGYLDSKRKKGFLSVIDHLAFSARLVQKYSTYIPNQSDYMYISSANGLSTINQNRLGIHTSISGAFRLNQKWKAVAGISYLYQKNYFKYEAQNLISLQQKKSLVDAVSNHIGVSVGINRKTNFFVGFDPALHLNVEFLKGFGSAQHTLDDILSLEVGYSLEIMEMASTQIRFKPVVSYSFLETKNTLYNNRPYWFGIQFSAIRKME